MGADEVGTVEALREHRSAADPLIAQRGGRIVKTTGRRCADRVRLGGRRRRMRPNRRVPSSVISRTPTSNVKEGVFDAAILEE
jgi:hypothetical protein